MTTDGPVTMLLTLRAKPGKSRELEDLVRRHGRALREAGLVTDLPIRVWRGFDERHPDRAGERAEPAGEPHFVELVQWRDAEASAMAHWDAAVMRIWTPMEQVLASLQRTIVSPLDARDDAMPGAGGDAAAAHDS